MCGVAGIVRPSGIDRAELGAMAAVLEHRGPDGLGFMELGHDGIPRVGHDLSALRRDQPGTVGFAHRRLAIIDLTDGNEQPALDPDGRFGLTYNGEIYNYVELRSELEARGHHFRTRGDTEVVLRSYMEWGEACVERFVGMWAFAIVDCSRRRVFLSRDRMGVKPLFYCLRGDSLYFASEIKGLLAIPAIRPEPEERAVASFLLDASSDGGELTFYEGILQLPAAHNISVPIDRPGDLARRRYWRIPDEAEVVMDDPASRFRELFSDSIRLHGRSDVPVGTCLSGGLDSSAIVGVASALRAEGEIPDYSHAAFGYVPSDSRYSERRFMSAVAEETGARLHVVTPSPAEFAGALRELVDQQDEPFGSASIAAQWFVFRAARHQGIKVMLDGQGADELFAGYLSYLRVIRASLLRRGRLRTYVRTARMHRQVFGDSGDSAMALGLAIAPRWLLSAVRAARGRDEMPALRDPAGRLASPHLHSIWRAHRGVRHEPRSLGELLRREAETTSLPALLRYEDRNSMAHSIEARVPFLDHRIVEFAFGLPDEWRVGRAGTKLVVREGVTDVVPESVRNRTDKMGFRADPGITWSLIDAHREEVLANRTAQEARWFDPAATRELIESPERSTEHEFLAWRMLSVKLWLRSRWGEGSEILS